MYYTASASRGDLQGISFGEIRLRRGPTVPVDNRPSRKLSVIQVPNGVACELAICTKPASRVGVSVVPFGRTNCMLHIAAITAGHVEFSTKLLRCNESP